MAIMWMEAADGFRDREDKETKANGRVPNIILLAGGIV